MARIRSVYPALFTDEAFVALTEVSQIFLIGLWTEADDNGMFEWKPVSLRMRLRPTKDGPVEPLLSELEAARVITSVEVDGRQYGMIRNFRKFQKPKYPNSIHPLPSEFRSYVGLLDAIPEIDGVEGDAIPETEVVEKGAIPGNATDQHPPIPRNAEKPLLRRGEERSNQESKNHPSGGEAPARPKREKKTATAVPAEPRLSQHREVFVAWAQQQHMPSAKAEQDFDRFIDHHRAKGSTFADWDAAGRTWIRNTIKFDQQRGGAGPPKVFPERETNGFVKILTGHQQGQDHAADHRIIDVTPNQPGRSGGTDGRKELPGR